MQPSARATAFACAIAHLLLPLVAGCARTSASSSHDAAPRPLVSNPSIADAGAVERAEPATSRPPSFTCRTIGPIETLDDGNAKADEDGRMALEHVQVLADESSTIVTWERQTEFMRGDSWRTPVAAVQRGSDPFRMVELPVHAYACATNGLIAPYSFVEPFVSWGVVNRHTFELWTRVPKTVRNFGASPAPNGDRAVTTGTNSIREIVTSRGVALATLGEYECEHSCSCWESRKSGLWIYGLDAKARFATRIAVTGKDDEFEAPALALGDSGGAAAYRLRGVLHLVWLDATGKPIGAPVPFDRGEVGAPALAVVPSGEVVVAWAKRETKTDPYRLRVMKLAPRAAPTSATPRVLATTGSAFAPALLADASTMTLAWTEGEAGYRGSVGDIHVARMPLDGSAIGHDLMVSTDETNARDPELSGTANEPVLVYSTFTKALPGGVVRLARLRCGEAPPQLH